MRTVSVSTVRIGDLEYEAQSRPGEYALRLASLASNMSWEQLADYMTKLTTSPHSGSKLSTLEAGRGVILRTAVGATEGLVRLYRRGGWAQYLSKHRFFSLPSSSLSQTRPVHEFCLNAVLFTEGCAVPRPLALFVRRRATCWWEGFIMTEVVPGKNLLSLLRSSAHSEVLAQGALAAGRAAGSALKAGVCHGDLHLGNVLYRDDGSVSLIDFDKAQVVRGPLPRYRELLESRWKRSAERHAAGSPVVESFCRGLREVVP